MTKIYLVRHAAAEGNLYRVAHGQFNSTITSRGYRQLSYLRKRFEGVHLDAVYGSDLLRAHTTAAALYVPRELEFHPLPLLREVCMGAWEQLSWGEIARQDAEMYENFNKRPHLWNVSGGESFAQVRDRMVQAVRQMAAENPDKTIAATSHGAALRVLLATLEGKTLEQLGDTPYGDNTAVSLIEVEGDEIRVVYRDDASHVPTQAKVVRHGAQSPQGGAVVAATQPGLWFRVLSEREDFREIEGLLGEEPAGRATFCREGNVLRITQCEIFPTLRGRHYSVQLIGQAVKFARQLDCEDVVVTCDNTFAAYFEKYGFTVVEKTGKKTSLMMDLRRVIREIPEVPAEEN